MLVLSRNALQSIFINGGEIIVKVLAIEGNRVKLGIEAPREISINRDELHHRMKADERDRRHIPAK